MLYLMGCRLAAVRAAETQVVAFLELAVVHGRGGPQQYAEEEDSSEHRPSHRHQFILKWVYFFSYFTQVHQV